jgi:hypothetical protein
MRKLSLCFPNLRQSSSATWTRIPRIQRRPPSSPFQNAGGSSSIPFTPKKRSRIQSITLWKRKPNKHVPESLLTTFGACLALACYSGRHQNPDRSLLNDEKGKEDSIRPVALVVNLEEDSKVLQKCLQVVSGLLRVASTRCST